MDSYLFLIGSESRPDAFARFLYVPEDVNLIELARSLLSSAAELTSQEECQICEVWSLVSDHQMNLMLTVY